MQMEKLKAGSKNKWQIQVLLKNSRVLKQWARVFILQLTSAFSFLGDASPDLLSVALQ